MVDEEVTEEEAVEQVKNLMEHPWVAPALNGLTPAPVLIHMNFEPVEIEYGPEEEGGETVTMDSSLLTIVDPTGVKTVYLSPQMVEQLVAIGAGMLQTWAEKNKHAKLLVPNKDQMQQARLLHDQQTQIRSV